MKHIHFFKLGLFIATPVFLITTTSYVNYSLGVSLNNNITKANTLAYSNYNDQALVNGFTNFNSYDPIYGGGTFETVATQDGTVGLSTDKKTLILTGYNGAIIWVNNLTKDTDLTKWCDAQGGQAAAYKTMVQQATINSYVKKLNEDRLVVLFGNTNNLNNFLIQVDLKTGKICSANGTYSVKKSGSNRPNIVLATSNANKFVLLNASQNNTGDVASFVPYYYTVNDGSIIEDSSKFEANIGGNPKFIGYVPGTIGSNFNLAFFANLTTDNQGNYTTAISYIVVNDNFEFYKDNSGSPLSHSYVSVPSTTASGIQDYRYDNGVKQFLFVGDRSVKSDSIKLVMPYYLSNKVGNTTNEKYRGGIAVLQTTTNLTNKSTNTSWWQGTDNSGRISQFSIDNNNVFASIEYTTGNYTNTGNNKTYGNKSNVINIKNLSSNNKNFIIARTGWGTGEDQLNKPDSLVAIPSANDDTKARYALRNKYNSKMFIYSANFVNGSVDLSTYNAAGDYESPQIKNDPNTALKADTTIKNNYIASVIPDNQLLPKLQYKKGNSSTYTSVNNLWAGLSTIDNKNPNDNAGTLSFDYKVTYKAPYDNTKELSYYVSASISDLYKMTNLKRFEFVTTESVDKTKWDKIEELKKAKSSNAITKEEIKNHFVVIDAIDKNNANFDATKLTNNDITLTPSTDGTSLTVSISLPANNFPTTGTDKFTKEHTFNGFLSDESIEAAKYSVTVDKTYSLASKYPSEVTLNDLIGKDKAIKLGTGYDNITIDKYTPVWTQDNINGTLTITSIKCNDANVPEKYKELLRGDNTPLTFTGLKNTVDLFNMDNIKINDISDKANLLKPTQIWKEYNDALTSNDQAKLKNTLIYKSIDEASVLQVLKDRNDLVLTPTNLDTADTDKFLNYTVTIKDNANLAYTVSNLPVVFNAEYKQKVTEKQKHPKTIKQNIYVDTVLTLQVDNTFITNNKINYDNTTETLTADLNVNPIGNINNNLTVKNFNDNLNTYTPELLKMFQYDSAYQTKFEYVNPVDINSNSVSLFVRFNLTNPQDHPNSIKAKTYTININNFKSVPEVSVDNDFIKNNNIGYDNTNNTLTVDLNNSTVGNINKETSLTNFKNNFDNYKNQLLLMFKYDQYESNLTLTNTNFDNNTASIKVDFNLNDNNYPTKSKSFTINISNFKSAPNVSVNQTFITNNNISYDNVSTLTIDLDKSTIGNINNKLSSQSFINGFDQYKSELLQMFIYQPFVPNFTLVNPDTNLNRVSIKAEFNLNDVNYQPATTIFTINIINFKVVEDVTVDQWVLDNNNNVEYVETNKNVIIDVSKDELFNMNNTVSYDDFINNFDSTYQNSILEVFDWNQYYTPVVSTPILNKDTKCVNVEIVFTLNTNVKNNSTSLKNSTINKPDKINMSVTIIGFKEPTMWVLIKIIVILLIALIILILSIYYSIAINRGRKAIVDDPNHKPIYMIDPNKDKEDNNNN